MLFLRSIGSEAPTLGFMFLPKRSASESGSSVLLQEGDDFAKALVSERLLFCIIFMLFHVSRSHVSVPRFE